MSTIWEQVGFIRYPLTLTFLVVVILAVWSAVKLFRPGATPDLRSKAWVDAILFWGGFAVITGVVGTLVGIIIAAQFIEAAEAISTSMVWGGIKVALLSSTIGVLILAFAALLWFALQLRWRFLMAEIAEA